MHACMELHGLMCVHLGEVSSQEEYGKLIY